MTLWGNDDVGSWREALASYDAGIAARKVNRLPELDHWYRLTLPKLLERRHPPFIAKEELIEVAEWKMKRGVYRGRNLSLIKKNSEAAVKSTSEQAFAAIPDLRQPISLIGGLSGVGPATSSAVLSAIRPDLFPFFDEDVAKQIPALTSVTFTQSYYFRYAEALRARALKLGSASSGPWSAQDVAQALWAAQLQTPQGGPTRSSVPR
jgi:hypothetical protein